MIVAKKARFAGTEIVLVFILTGWGLGSSFQEANLFSMFGFRLDMRAADIRKLAADEGLVPKNESPRHQTFEGFCPENPGIGMVLMLSFEGRRVYAIDIDLRSEARISLEPLARAARESAAALSAPVSREEVFEGFHFHYGDIFLKNGVFISIGLYEDINEKPVLSIKYRRQSDYLRAEIGQMYLFELKGPGWRVPEKLPFDGLPETIDGEEIFRSGKGIVGPKPVVGPKPMFQGQTSYVFMICLIGSKGAVRGARIRQASSPVARAEAKRAISQARYSPATKDGVPVPCYIPVIFDTRASADAKSDKGGLRPLPGALSIGSGQSMRIMP